MEYTRFITIRINEITPKNSKIKYSVWCDSEGEKPKFIMAGLTKNEALELAQEHDILHKDHLLRVEDVRVEFPASEIPTATPTTT